MPDSSPPKWGWGDKHLWRAKENRSLVAPASPIPSSYLESSGFRAEAPWYWLDLVVMLGLGEEYLVEPTTSHFGHVISCLSKHSFLICKIGLI